MAHSCYVHATSLCHASQGQLLQTLGFGLHSCPAQSILPSSGLAAGFGAPCTAHECGFRERTSMLTKIVNAGRTTLQGRFGPLKSRESSLRMFLRDSDSSLVAIRSTRPSHKLFVPRSASGKRSRPLTHCFYPQRLPRITPQSQKSKGRY